jgi:SpoVK/Ycf46/Vps4 family AAA+-type ATPase
MGNEQSKKGKRILEEKKKALANLTHKKEKMDKIHSAVNKDISIINISNFPEHQHFKNQNYTNPQTGNESADNHLNRNNSFNASQQNHDVNQINIDNEIIRANNLNAKRNHSANKDEFYQQNNQISNINNINNVDMNNVSKSVFIPSSQNNIKNNSKNLNNLNTNKNMQMINNSISVSKIEKLVKDLEIMDKLVEKYKIIYLDSYYFKRDKNYNEAIERNLQGQEYTEKLLIILYQKKEKEYDKHINILKNLQNQFITLMQEIQSEMRLQGKDPEAVIKSIQSKKNLLVANSIPNKPSNSSNSLNSNLNNCNNNKSQNQSSLLVHKSNTPEDILERIKSEILDKNPKIKFDEVVGLENVKQALKEIIIIPSLRPDLFTGLRTPAKGLLLFGPPGTGKTLIAKAVATECKSVFFNISASSLTSKYVGESEKLVKALFEVARYPENQPAIIFIDEIESILSKRSENDNEVSKRLKTEFLVQFDGVATSANDRILVIGATNRPQDLDPAVLRRLPKKIFVGPMDFKGKANFVFEILSKSKTEHTLIDKDFCKIAEMTENYSNSDLKELCRHACIEPIRELKEGQLEKIDKLRPICSKDFEKAIKAIRGTLTSEMLEEYLTWNKENGALN